MFEPPTIQVPELFTPGAPGTGGMPLASILGQIAYFNGTLWVATPTGPTAAGQAPVWDGTKYIFQNQARFYWGAGSIGAAVATEYVPYAGGGGSSSAAGTNLGLGGFIALSSGSLSKYSYQSRVSAYANDLTVRLYKNGAFTGQSFVVPAGTSAMNGTWTASYVENDVLAVTISLAVAGDGTSRYPFIITR